MDYSHIFAEGLEAQYVQTSMYILLTHCVNTLNDQVYCGSICQQVATSHRAAHHNCKSEGVNTSWLTAFSSLCLWVGRKSHISSSSLYY